MAYFAVSSGNKIVNIIVADDLETAESLTNTTCIEYTLDEPIGINATLIDGVWVNPIEPNDEVTE